MLHGSPEKQLLAISKLIILPTLWCSKEFQTWSHENQDVVVIFPMWRNNPLSKQTWFHFAKGCFVPSLFEFGPMVLKKNIFPCHQCFFLNYDYLPLGKDVTIHLIKIIIPFIWGFFLQSLVEIGPVILKRKLKMRKVYKDEKSLQTNWQTNDKQQGIRKAHLSLKLRRSKENTKKTTQVFKNILSYR